MTKMLFFAALLPIAAFGQTAHEDGAGATIRAFTGRPAVVEQILDAQSCGPAQQKPTALLQRIVARTITAGGFTDSLRYYWSTTDRGADHNPLIAASYEENQFSPFLLYGTSHGEFVARQPYIRADSVLYNPWYPYYRRVYQYGAGNRPVRVLTEQKVNNAWDRERFDLTYDAAGHNVLVEWHHNDSANTVSENAFQGQRSAYDLQGRLEKDSTYIGNAGTNTSQPDFQWYYHYSAAGRLDSMLRYGWYLNIWQLNSRYRFTYLPNGLLHTARYDGLITTGWVTYVMDSFVYNGNNPAYTYSEHRDAFFDPGDSTGAISPLELESYSIRTLNAAGLWDTITNFDRNTTVFRPTPVIWNRQVITYNSFNNRETLAFQSYDSTGAPLSNASLLTRYYYQTYDPASVADMPSPKVPSAWASPNPANGSIFVRPAGASATQAARYRFTDMAGSLLKEGKLAGHPAATEIDVRALRAGVYMFSALDEHGRVLHTERVIRQ